MKISKHSVKLQQKYEGTFGKRGILDAAIEDIKDSPSIVTRIETLAISLSEWIYSPSHRPEKLIRLEKIEDLDMESIVYRFLALILLHTQDSMKLVSVASMCAGHLKMDNKAEAIQTAAELIVQMAIVDLCQIDTGAENVRWVRALFSLDPEVIRYAFNAMYLPPLIIKPRKLRHNKDSGYLTEKGDSLILGYKENYHDGDICLDVINTMNANCYELDKDFISARQEKWHREELDTEEYNELSYEKKLIYDMDESTWNGFIEQGYKIQTLMLYHGNEFYFQNKVDKRGRLYTSGYHLSPQGSSFKKAMLNLKHKEICTGVDQWITK